MDASGGGKAGKGKSSKSGAGNRGGITTLSDLHRHVESDSDSEGPQEYYTGGEKSGMMVQDPNRGRKDVDAIFERARQSGAREGFAPAEPATRSSFAGPARTLAGDHRLPEPAQEQAAETGPVFHTITFWRNGFTVDNGPLRRFDDPANAPFLNSINKTECPRELEPASQTTPVHVNLVRREEDWQAPKEPKQVLAFQGTGRTLGGSTPAVPPSAAPAPLTPREAGTQPAMGLVVDDKKPSTSIQLRLSDGTRMVARFNHHHTVGDIRGFIQAARPGTSGSYQLQTMGFPPKQLTDPLQTIEEAGLISAVVIQRGG